MKLSTSSMDSFFKSSCRSFTEPVTSKNPSRSKDDPSCLCGHRRNDIRHRHHDTSHDICFERFPSLSFAWDRVSNSDLSHRSDRFQWGTHYHFARQARRRIDTSRFVFKVLFHHGRHCVPQNLYYIRGFARTRSADRGLACGDRLQVARDHRIRNRARKRSKASR